MNATRFILLSIVLFSPALLPGQKKEDLASIQRDVASMDDHVKQLQKSFDDKLGALLTMMQQSIDASNKTAASVAALQHYMDQKMSDQQTKLVTPVATLSTKVDEMSGDFNAVAANVKELVRHMNDLDAKIADISSAIRTLNNPAPPPPQPTGVPGGTAVQVPDSAPGMSAELMYNAAYRDYMGKKDDQALDEFLQFVKRYPQTAEAPEATFYIGQIYYRGQDYTNAIKAFDDVLEKFPPNPRTGDAAYMKACALMGNHQNTDAGKEFKAFLAKYPDNAHVAEAHKHLVELGLEQRRRKG
jgi:TolA-binding protein